MLVLSVFVEGEDAPVGELSRLDTGSARFQYLRNDLPHPISLSLPVREEAYDDVSTRAFFDNLLFENIQRDRVMQRHGLEYGDTVGLLSHLGRDCPGAISVVPQGEGPAKAPGNLETDYAPVENLSEIMRALRDTRRLPAEIEDPSPLAGVQGKVALTRLLDGRFALPKPGLNVPTTHILKVPRGHEARQVEYEHVMMGIFAQVQKHPVARTEILEREDVRGLLIERFDRRVEGPRVSRIHQEDFCQALGLGPDLKYQRNGEDGRIFSAARIGEIIVEMDSPARARQALLEGTVANILLGNTDNHAKNHALLYRGVRPELAPFYDVVPTILDEDVTHQLSFDIGSARMTDEIGPGDLEGFAEEIGYRRMIPKLKKRLETMTRDISAFVPEMAGPARKRIGDAIAEQARWIAQALDLDLDLPERDLIIINRPD